mmetsp:Transcript_9408/g.23976  ORF Transcript_9408/g.23976 Transcript_9408/m.23976 type:complete len:343 (+) Transcript_9408:31-1059(+)
MSFVVAILVVAVTTMAVVMWKRRPTRTGASVKAIYVYPIKSGAAVAVDEAVVDSQSGLAFDRLWTVVDGRGVFMSQRRAPKLALVKASLPTSTAEPLVLSAPGAGEISVPQICDGPSKVVRIWEDHVAAIDQGDDVAEWLSKYLDVPNLRLVRMPKSTNRWCETAYAPLAGARAAFSDGYPILVTNQASMDDLNAKMKTPLPMDRFRPNVVVEGADPWDEDTWLAKTIAIGTSTFLVAKPCARCKMPTICQSTGTVGGAKTRNAADDDDDDLGGGPKPGAEPTATLTTFRTGKDLGFAKAAWKDEVFFGQNVCHVGISAVLARFFDFVPKKTIKVGDAVLLP